MSRRTFERHLNSFYHVDALLRTTRLMTRTGEARGVRPFSSTEEHCAPLLRKARVGKISPVCYATTVYGSANPPLAVAAHLSSSFAEGRNEFFVARFLWCFSLETISPIIALILGSRGSLKLHMLTNPKQSVVRGFLLPGVFCVRCSLPFRSEDVSLLKAVHRVRRSESDADMNELRRVVDELEARFKSGVKQEAPSDAEDLQWTAFDAEETPSSFALVSDLDRQLLAQVLLALEDVRIVQRKRENSLHFEMRLWQRLAQLSATAQVFNDAIRRLGYKSLTHLLVCLGCVFEDRSNYFVPPAVLPSSIPPPLLQ